VKSKQQKIEEAKKRNEAYAQLSIEEKLARLDRAGLGAVKQRKQFAKLLPAPTPTEFVVPEAVVSEPAEIKPKVKKHRIKKG
jgi:hypothetical protein